MIDAPFAPVPAPTRSLVVELTFVLVIVLRLLDACAPAHCVQAAGIPAAVALGQPKARFGPRLAHSLLFVPNAATSIPLPEAK